MKNFPQKFTPDNKEKFAEYNRKRLRAYMIRDVYETFIAGGEAYYIDSFVIKRETTTEIAKEILRSLVPDLEKLGWTVKLLYNDSALYVYGNEVPEIIKAWVDS